MHLNELAELLLPLDCIGLLQQGGILQRGIQKANHDVHIVTPTGEPADQLTLRVEHNHRGETGDTILLAESHILLHQLRADAVVAR